MDSLIGILSVLLLMSASTFLWLSIVDSQRDAAGTEQSGQAAALDDLMGARRPLFPRTIQQTPLD
jgi:hypothetical protein